MGKEEKVKCEDKKEGQNRERSLGYPGFVRPVFTTDSKPLGGQGGGKCRQIGGGNGGETLVSHNGRCVEEHRPA
ncbi:hypothetical protein TNCV_3122111 [Trichonephila clavipes]|nr:hypothetical protein TNCV_3122111 [Trichonephila clavipes]